MNISLTDREADLMQVLWEHGPTVVSEVRDRLIDQLFAHLVSDGKLTPARIRRMRALLRGKPGKEGKR